MKHSFDSLALLQENKKALQFAFLTFGIDFEQEHKIIKGVGNFTVKSVLKQINEPYNKKIIVLVKPYNAYRCEKLHAVTLNPVTEQFSINRNITEYYYNNNIDYYFSKGNFEDDRKDKKTVYYIIYQDEKHLKPHKKLVFDFSQRYKVKKINTCYDGAHRSYIGYVDLITTTTKGEEITYNLRSYPQYWYNDRAVLISDIIDKSGYIIKPKREDLKRRAIELRAKRKKAEADRINHTESIKKIDTLVEQAKTAIIKALSEARTSKEFRIISEEVTHLYWGYSNIERHFKKLNEKTYPTKESAENETQEILQKIEKIIKTIQGGGGDE